MPWKKKFLEIISFWFELHASKPFTSTNVSTCLFLTFNYGYMEKESTSLLLKEHENKYICRKKHIDMQSVGPLGGWTLNDGERIFGTYRIRDKTNIRQSNVNNQVWAVKQN